MRLLAFVVVSCLSIGCTDNATSLADRLGEAASGLRSGDTGSSLIASYEPAIGGALMASGLLAAPLLIGGLLKIAYDLALWRAFRHHEKE